MRVFLSYHHSDEKFVSKLRDELTEQGLDVWNPSTGLTTGSNWLIKTGRALQRADAIVFVLSKRALQSPSMQREIDYALTTKRFANRVFAVIVGNAVKVPWILSELGAFKSTSTSAKSTARQIARVISEIRAEKTSRRPAKATRDLPILTKAALLKRASPHTAKVRPKAKAAVSLKG